MSIAAAVILAIPLAAFAPTPRAVASESPSPVIAKSVSAPSTSAKSQSSQTAASCDEFVAGRTGRGTMVHTHGDADFPGSRRVDVLLTSATRCLEVRFLGMPQVTADERDFVSIPMGAMVYLRERDASADRELTVTPGADGGVQRVFRRDGAAAPFDAAARDWAAQLLPVVLREASIDAPQRVARLRSDGGVPRVLAMIASLESNDAQREHYMALLDMKNLSGADIDAVLVQMRRDLAESSGDLRAALSRIQPRQVTGLHAVATMGDAIGDIESSGDKASAVTQVAMNPDASDSLLVAVMRAARSIDSDGDKARVLITTAARYLVPGKAPLRTVYFNVARSIQSDGDKHRVLVGAAPYGHADAEVTHLVIMTARGIESDGDKAATLITLATQRLLSTAGLRDEYLDAARTIESEGDRSRALSAAVLR